MLEQAEKARLRGQALDSLRADLAAWGNLLADNPTSAGAVEVALRRWLDDPDLGGVRGVMELDALPGEEREAWLKLWGEVRDLMSRADKK